VRRRADYRRAPAVYPLPTPNLGEGSRDLFPWDALKVAVAGMFARMR
jgi:hypothetical protein